MSQLRETPLALNLISCQMRTWANLTNQCRIKGNSSGSENFSQTAESYTLLYNFQKKSLFIFNPETFLSIFAAEGSYVCDGQLLGKCFLSLILKITVDCGLVLRKVNSNCHYRRQNLIKLSFTFDVNPSLSARFG